LSLVALAHRCLRVTPDPTSAIFVFPCVSSCHCHCRCHCHSFPRSRSRSVLLTALCTVPNRSSQLVAGVSVGSRRDQDADAHAFSIPSPSIRHRHRHRHRRDATTLLSQVGQGQGQGQTVWVVFVGHCFSVEMSSVQATTAETIHQGERGESKSARPGRRDEQRGRPV
jgi:hypothetical protein